MSEEQSTRVSASVDRQQRSHSRVIVLDAALDEAAIARRRHVCVHREPIGNKANHKHVGHHRRKVHLYTEVEGEQKCV